MRCFEFGYFGRLVIPGRERVIQWKDCERCEGTGDVGPHWIEEWGSFKVLMGHVMFCPLCGGSGKLVASYMTRGVSLPPLIHS